jgi:HEAT repeat protein
MTPDEMIEKLLDPSSDSDDGATANDLLGHFWNGYPIENLRRLLVPAGMGAAAFLASELGQKVRPLLPEVAELLQHESSSVRFDAIDALAECTTWEDGWAVAMIVRALGDPHEGVRWKVCRALRSMESSKLHAGLDYLHAQEPESVFASFRNAFLAIEQYPKRATAAFHKLLNSEEPVARRFGAAMVVRPRLFIDPAFVELAAGVEDAEVAKFIGDAIEAPSPHWVAWEAPLKKG